MKSIFFMIVWIIIWYFLWAYSFFTFTVNFGADKISQIVIDSAKNVYSWSLAWTWANAATQKTINDMIAQKKQELVNQIAAKESQLKSNLRDQLVNYMTSQINQLFGKM